MSLKLAGNLLKHTKNFNTVVRNSSSSVSKSGSLMDQLPVPSGSWQEHYSKNQTRYNLHLAFGIGFAIFSVASARMLGYLDLNLTPPEHYE